METMHPASLIIPVPRTRVLKPEAFGWPSTFGLSTISFSLLYAGGGEELALIKGSFFSLESKRSGIRKWILDT